MREKYEILLERSVRSQECANDVSTSLLEVAKNLEANTKKLNDEFVLHNAHSIAIKEEMYQIRGELMRWVKWLAITLFLAVGGTTVLNFIIKNGLIQLPK